MAEITGGELGFEFTLDAENLKKGLTDSEGRLMGFTEAAEKAGITIQNGFAKSGAKVQDFTGIVKENISIQKQVIKELESQIKEVQNRASGMAPGIGQATILNEAKALEKELAAEKAALADLELAMGKAATTSTTLGTKLAEAKNRLAELNLASKEGKEVTAEQFREAEAEVKKYGEAISDTNARTKALTAGTIGSLAQGLSLVTGTMAMGTSLMGAFGGKSEELNQIMLKTQALLAATVTLQEIKNTTIQQGGVISGVMAVQEYARARGADAAALASGRATIAQRAWNLVANANPYVLLATAILSVVGAIGLYVVATNQAEAKTKALIDLNKKIADSVAEPLVAYRTFQNQWNALGNDLKAKEKFIKDNKDEFNKLGVEVGSVTDAENVLVANTAAFVQSMMLKAKATAMQQKAVEDTRKSLELEAEYRRKYIDKDLTTGEKLLMPTQAASRSYAKSDAEEIRKLNQGIYNDSLKQLEVEKKIAEIGNKAGFRTPGKGQKASTAKPTTPTSPAPIKPDDILPAGSVVEIQKRLAEIDKALSRSNNDDSTKLLKARRTQVALELAAAEKKIRIKTFDEELADTKKQIELRDKLLQAGYSKEKVDSMLPEVKDKSYIGYLEETAASLKNLVAAGDNTEQTAANIIKIREAIDEFQGNETFLEGVTNSIDNLKSKFSGSALITQLEKYKSASIIGGATEEQKNARKLAAEEAIKQEEAALKAAYQSFLNEHQSFEEQKAGITKRYDDLRKSNEDSNLSPDQKIQVKIEIDSAEAQEQLELFFTQMQSDGKFAKIFVEMNSVATSRLEEFRNILVEKLKTAKSEADKIKIGEFIEKIDKTLRERNPMKAIKDMFKAIGDEAMTTEEKLSKLKDGIDSVQGYLKDAAGIVNDVRGAFDDLGISTDNAFGDILDDVSQTIEGLSQMADGVMTFAEGFATKDPVKMVAGAVKAIAGAIKAVAGWFNDDKKKEREIKKQAAALKELEKVYNDLGRAIDKALGEGVFTASQDAITNLKQQKAILEQMMRTEQSKKKADQEKINGYKDQINSINNAIEDMQQSMIDKVLNGLNAKGLADKLSDALTTAFQNGENAAEAMGKTVDDILRDMVKNALKMKILEPAMQAVVDKMLQSMGYSVGANGVTGTFDGLTEAEREELKNMMQQAGANYMDALGAYTELFGSQAANAQGLKGDIKGITEKTAGALEAQINAMRQYQVEGLNIHRNNQQTFIASLQNLVMIEANTRHLIRMDQTLMEMNSKMKKGLAGI